MVQPTQHGNGANLVRLVWRRSRTHRRLRNPLPKPLMGSGLIEVHRIGFEKPAEVLLIQDEEVIQTFSSHAPQKAFTYGICLWSPIRRSKHFDATCCCYSCKTRPKFAIIIPNEIFGCLPIRSRFPQLLRYPLISRRARHIYMDDFPRFQFNDEEGKQLTEEEVCHLQEITGPPPPTPLPHDCGEMSSNSGYELVLDESAYTSESCVYSPEYPA
jgi:hypothetical protein